MSGSTSHGMEISRLLHGLEASEHEEAAVVEEEEEEEAAFSVVSAFE
jgi:hypothetical protein